MNTATRAGPAETDVNEASPQVRLLTIWSTLLVAFVICVSIGTPLVGARVFLGTDILGQQAPWRDLVPPDFGPTNPEVTDTIDWLMPQRAEFRRAILHGRYPMWTPYPSGGGPLGTVPDIGGLSPLNLPFLILPLWYAPAVTKLMELTVAAAFTFLFLRRIGLGKPAALIGGLIFMNSGFEVGWTNWPQAQVGALIPALFWAAERAIQVRTIRSAAPVAVVVAVMIFAGFPAVTMYALVAATLYVLVRLACASGLGSKVRIQVVVKVGGAVLVGVGLTALQLLPFREHLDTVNLAYRGVTPASHSAPRGLVTLAIPNAFGSTVDHNYFGALHLRHVGRIGLNYHELQSFIGSSALLLVVVGLARARRASDIPRGVRTYLWAATAVAVLLIYHGGAVLGLLQHFSLFRTNFIGRLRSVFGFVLASLAAMGFQTLMSDRQGSRRTWAWQAIVWGSFVLASAFAASSLWRLAGEAGQRGYVVRHSIIPLLAAGVTLGAIVFGHRVKLRGHHLLLMAVPLVMAVESLAFVVPYWPRTSKALFYPSTPAIKFLQLHLGRDRVAAAERTLLPGATTYYGIRSVTARAFLDERWRDLVRTANGGRPTGYIVTRLHAIPEVADSPVLDRVAARYFVADPADPVFGRAVALSPPVGTIALGADSAVAERIPSGRIRAVVVRIAGPSKDLLPGAHLLAEVLDGSGNVLTSGTRRLDPTVRTGAFAIPVVEIDDLRQGRTDLTARITLVGPSGHLRVAADGNGRPSLSLVLGGGDRLRLVFVDDLQIYQRLDAMPRIRWVGRAESSEDRRERLFLLSGHVDPDVVLLNEPGPAGSGMDARLRVLQDDETEVRVRVTASGAGYVVIADPMQHGWEAFVDGNASRLFPAEHAMVAVYVPAGEHEVTVRYSPRSWRQGQLISGLSLVMVVVAFAFPRHRVRLKR